MGKYFFIPLTALMAFLVAGPAMAQQGAEAPTYEYGGSIDPLGTGSEVLKEATKKQAVGSAPSYLGRGGPINLRSGGYVSHEQSGTPAKQEIKQAVKPTSVKAYNRNLVKQQLKKSLTVDDANVPPGWGVYNEFNQ